MTPTELKLFLVRMVLKSIEISVMIWGPPGVGKSSIVKQIADDHGLEFIDVRLSQLAPTDLRGLPVPEDGIAKWYPPDFLPRDGSGIFFFDELNMAPPTMQGIAQQMLLDRKVGKYQVPPGWLIWAAGNRKEDRASVFDMPAPVANRLLHLTVEPDLESFKEYALKYSVHEEILSFLSFRPSLLHRYDPHQAAWPSPRSWIMASKLHHAGLDIAPAVGEGLAAEFRAFLEIYQHLPDLSKVLLGEGDKIPFPDELSARYAVTMGLVMRATSAQECFNALLWLSQNADVEWVQVFVSDSLQRLRSQKQLGQFAALVQQVPELQRFMKDALQLMGGAL